MIDLHTHFLFDIDDGARNLDASLEMLRAAELDGTEMLVATPHQLHPAGYHATREVAEERLAAVKAAAAEAGIRMDFRLAAEIHFSESMIEGLKEGSLLPLAGCGKYFLLELPVTTIPWNIRDVVFECQMAGYFPVLAHPERNFEVMESPKVARELRDRGVLLQVTAQSVTGAFGKKSERAARRLLKWGVVDVIASDAHNPKRRPPGLSAAVERASKIVGPGRAEWMVTEAPRRILAGESMD